MLSRVADSIFWMLRYIERAENYARFVDVNFNISLDVPAEFNQQWEPLIKITGDWDLFQELYNEIDKKNAIRFLAFEKSNPNSIYNSILNARENARGIRPDITLEVWESINSLYYLIQEAQQKKVWLRKNPRDLFHQVRDECLMLNGIFSATISREESWHFAKLGQMIERADQTSRMIDVKYHILLPSVDAVGTPIDIIHWASILKSVSAYDMYRKQFGTLLPRNIVQFLILDSRFPRSIYRCLLHSEHSLYKITGRDSGFTTIAEKQLGKLKSKLEFDDINEIFNFGLHEYIDEIQQDLRGVSSAIYESFFQYNK